MLEKGEMKNEEMKKRMEELRSSSSSSAALKSVDQKFREIDKLFDKFSEKNHEQLSNAEIKPIHEKYTHTQCVFHIIRLRLIIFHTPKFFNGDFHFKFFFINFFLCMYTMHEKWGQF